MNYSMSRHAGTGGLGIEVPYIRVPPTILRDSFRVFPTTFPDSYIGHDNIRCYYFVLSFYEKNDIFFLERMIVVHMVIQRRISEEVYDRRLAVFL